MQYVISSGKADELIRAFLKQNGFSEKVMIKRYYDREGNLVLDSRGEPITDIMDFAFYRGEFIPCITRVTRYTKLLKGVLNFRGNPTDCVELNDVVNLSYLISIKEPYLSQKERRRRK